MNKPKLSLLNDPLTNSMERTPVLKYVPYFLLFHEKPDPIKGFTNDPSKEASEIENNFASNMSISSPGSDFFLVSTYK